MNIEVYMPKNTLVQSLVDREGYSQVQATEIVEVIIQAMKSALAAGKNVKIDGLGELRVVQRRPRHRIEKNLRNVGTALIKRPRHRLGVKLHSKKDFTCKS